MFKSSCSRAPSGSIFNLLLLFPLQWDKEGWATMGFLNLSHHFCFRKKRSSYPKSLWIPSKGSNFFVYLFVCLSICLIHTSLLEWSWSMIFTWGKNVLCSVDLTLSAFLSLMLCHPCSVDISCIPRFPFCPARPVPIYLLVLSCSGPQILCLAGEDALRPFP